jgi:hypothetical protein
MPALRGQEGQRATGHIKGMEYTVTWRADGRITIKLLASCMEHATSSGIKSAIKIKELDPIAPYS